MEEITQVEQEHYPIKAVSQGHAMRPPQAEASAEQIPDKLCKDGSAS